MIDSAARSREIFSRRNASTSDLETVAKIYLDLFRRADGSLNWGKMIAIWDGGLAIYGAVIMAFIVLHTLDPGTA